MYRARDSSEERLTRTVKADNLNAIANFEIGANKLADSLRWAACRRGKTTDDVKYMQKEPSALTDLDRQNHGKSRIQEACASTPLLLRAKQCTLQATTEVRRDDDIQLTAEIRFKPGQAFQIRGASRTARWRLHRSPHMP